MPSVTYEYGKALYELACDECLTSQYLSEIRQARSILKSEEKLIEILASPIIPKEERTDVVERIFAPFLPNIRSYIKILTERGRARQITDCFDEFEKLWYENSGIIVAIAVSAVRLTDEQIDRLKANLEQRTGRDVELRTEVDASLIGGIKITVNGELIDGTVVGKLSRIKENILNNHD